MKQTNPNDSVYPVALGGKDMNGEDDMLLKGLTIRQQFAAMAMQGILSGDEINRTGKKYPESISELAVQYADALIAELNK